MRRISLPELRRLGGARWAAGGGPVLAQLPMVPTFQELRPALEGELRRSRRYERPLAVLVVVPALGPLVSAAANGRGTHSGNGLPHDADAVGTGEWGAAGDHEVADTVVRPLFWAQLRFVALGSLLYGTLRESDIVSYAAELQEFVALLPECDGAAAHRAVDRLHQLYTSRIGSGLHAGMAVYPADGLTLDDLLAHARRALAQRVICPPSIYTNGNGAAHV
jgi:hypothetical protein